MEVLADVKEIHHTDDPAASRTLDEVQLEIQARGVRATISNSVLPHLMQVNVVTLKDYLPPVVFRNG